MPNSNSFKNTHPRALAFLYCVESFMDAGVKIQGTKEFGGVCYTIIVN